jgi:hypothetical protein
MHFITEEDEEEKEEKIRIIME